MRTTEIIAAAAISFCTLLSVYADGISINGELMKARPQKNGESACIFKYDFSKSENTAKNPPGLNLLTKNGWKKHPTVPAYCGYNGEMEFKLQSADPITKAELILFMGSQDNREREIECLCSTDGKNYTSAAMLKFARPPMTPNDWTTPLALKVDAPANTGTLYIRCQRNYAPDDNNGIYGFVLIRDLELSVTTCPNGGNKKQPSEK